MVPYARQGQCNMNWHKTGELSKMGLLKVCNSLHSACSNLLLSRLMITDLPFSLYSTFVIEALHGFIKQTIWLFIRDMIKGIILATIIGPPIVAAIIVIVQKGSPWPSIFGGFCLYYLL
ncbi:CAAX prenyl protease 1 homolog [Camellia sinensis]|uniref:CAAX prenyl protease 1 homolog n=1 Tax=Camellia sinensis TaxID=4442 RepID=UPI00103582F4|nr:CAAX prenyl protease 1 homolog [Camellia sinensis]